jgi:hypothetical protein
MAQTKQMTDEHRTIDMHDDETTLRVQLPGRIGYVEIHTGYAHGPTGFPTVGVEVVSATQHTPADDGRLYSPTFSVRDDTVVLVGRPGPKLLEAQRQVEWFEKVITKHDSGDHSECPDTCPAKEN